MKSRCQGYRRSIKGKCRVAAWAGTSAIHREEPLMCHLGKPAAMASGGPATDPAAPETAGPDGYGLHPLDAADAAYRGEVEDLQTEVLTGFLAAMRGLDPDDLDRAPLASRLCWAAWRAGQALAPCGHGSS